MRRSTPPLLLLLALAAPLQAQRPEDYDYENLAFSGIGAHLYGVLPARSEPTLGVQLRADLGTLGPNVRIAPSVTFWSSDIREGELENIADRIEASCERAGSPCPGVSLGQVRLSDLSVDVDAHYLFTTDVGIEPYAGIGAGLHLVDGRGDFIEDTFVEDVLDAITPGFNAMAGVEIPLGPSLRLEAEARGVLASNARWAGLSIGATWVFLPQRPAAPRPQPAGGQP
jgi:hypothetical protein